VRAGRTTRRELVRGGLAAGVGGALGRSILAAPVASAAAGSAGDADVLSKTLSVEQLVVFSYQRAVGSGALESGVAGQIRGMLSQELRHVATLESVLRSLGARIPAAPRDVASAQRALATHHVVRSLTDLHTQFNCLKLLIDVESVAEGAYFSAIASLSDPGRVRTAAGIMGCEAQHWTIISELLNDYNVMRSVPYPFVAGST
jgi:hypothetical protein